MKSVSIDPFESSVFDEDSSNKVGTFVRSELGAAVTTTSNKE